MCSGMKVLVITHFAGILNGRKPAQKAGCVTYYMYWNTVSSQADGAVD